MRARAVASCMSEEPESSTVDIAAGGISERELEAIEDRANEVIMERRPVLVSFEEAATLPHSAILALQGMRLGDGRTFEPGASTVVKRLLAPPCTSRRNPCSSGSPFQPF